jgi:hypothetical protein
MFPLRGLWNSTPPEGDKFCNAEIDWLVTTKSSAVQFSLSGNSPVSLSQIVALSVDNSRSGADVDFVFPDSGFVLTVPARNQLIAPVFTNALMFYASAPGAQAGDTTVFQILNSMPPPVPIAPSTTQNHNSANFVSLTNGTTVIIPASISGTVNSYSFTVNGTTGVFNFQLIDGVGSVIMVNTFTLPDNTALAQSGLSMRFRNGLNGVISSSTAVGTLVGNVYYSIP